MSWTRRGCARWVRGGSTRIASPSTSPNSSPSSTSAASTTAAISRSRGAGCGRRRSAARSIQTGSCPTSASTRKAAWLPCPPIDRLLGFAQGHGRLRAIVNAELPPLVAPFRGERYAAKEVSALIAPPYDVISSEDRARFAAQDPHNIVHLILPEAPSGRGGTGDRYAQAATLLKTWRGKGVVRPHAAGSVYVVAPGYALPSGGRRARARGVAPRRARPLRKPRARPPQPKPPRP